MPAWVVPVAGSAVGVAIVGALVHAHLGELAAALGSAAPAALAGACLLHCATLVLRAEAWRIVLRAAAGRRQPGVVVHGASAWAFLAGTALSHLTMPVRIAALRRAAPAVAPSPARVLIAEAPILVVETAWCLLLVALAAGGRVGWWLALAGAAGAAVLGLALRRAPTLAMLLGALTVLTVARVWVVLAAVGLPHGASEVGLVFGAMTVACLLPTGQAAAPLAVLAALGGAGAAAAAAGGLLIAASSVAGVLLYGAAVGAVVAARALSSPRAGDGGVGWSSRRASSSWTPASRR